MFIARSLAFPLFFLVIFSCSAQITETAEMAFSGGKKIYFLDKTSASEAIVVDQTDRFFDRVTIAELSIQMKKTFEPNDSREAILKEYKTFLKDDVEGFTEDEVAYIGEVMNEIYATCAKVSPALLPNSLKLIKTSAKHYGESVYYTRENCIIIPYNELRRSNREYFTHTMYHELFHVVSRLNPTLRKNLYGLIGFQSVGVDNLRLPSPLAARTLYNPDGVDFGQIINLQNPDGTSFYAVPIIYASETGYTPKKPTFFGYLNFQLFQVVENQDGSWAVITDKDGFSSTLDLRKIPDFFKQIKDNTAYIIHPDEILADNFTFLMTSKNDPKTLEKYNAEGRALIADIEKVITSPESVFNEQAIDYKSNR